MRDGIIPLPSPTHGCCYPRHTLQPPPLGIISLCGWVNKEGERIRRLRWRKVSFMVTEFFCAASWKLFARWKLHKRCIVDGMYVHTPSFVVICWNCSHTGGRKEEVEDNVVDLKLKSLSKGSCSRRTSAVSQCGCRIIWSTCGCSTMARHETTWYYKWFEGWCCQPERWMLFPQQCIRRLGRSFVLHVGGWMAVGVFVCAGYMYICSERRCGVSDLYWIFEQTVEERMKEESCQDIKLTMVVINVESLLGSSGDLCFFI